MKMNIHILEYPRAKEIIELKKKREQLEIEIKDEILRYKRAWKKLHQDDFDSEEEAHLEREQAELERLDKEKWEGTYVHRKKSEEDEDLEDMSEEEVEKELARIDKKQSDIIERIHNSARTHSTNTEDIPELNQ